MSSKNSKIILIPDTSILRQNSSLNTPEIELISELSRIQEIDFRIPEVVEGEYLSQKIESIEKHYDQIITTLKSIARNSILSRDQVSSDIEKYTELREKEIDTIQKRWKSYKREKNISIIYNSSINTSKVFKDYFDGQPPFAKKKLRKDIPDSFILHAILSLQNRDAICFVGADNALIHAVSEYKIRTYNSLSEFLKIPEISSIQRTLEDLQSIKPELQQVKDNSEKIKEWISEHLNKIVPFELYNLSGESSMHRDTVTAINSIHSIFLNFDKARIFPDTSQLLVPVEIDASLKLEYIYSAAEYAEKTKYNVIQVLMKMIDQEESDEGILMKEPFSGKIQMSIKIGLSKPFSLSHNIITYSDISKKFIISDLLNKLKE